MPRVIRASKLGDAAILKELIKILAENKIRVIKSNFYNPELTLFLKKGLEKGCKIKNGLEMLEMQAEESWKIWNN